MPNSAPQLAMFAGTDGREMTPLSTLATVEDITPTRPRCRLTLAERWADAMRRKEVGRG